MRTDLAGQLLTISEAAAILGVPDAHIRRLIADREVRITQRGQETFLSSDDLERLENHPRRHGPARLPWVLPWLTAGAVVAIVVGSLLPGVSVDYDKEAHWFAYLVLSFLVTCSLPQLARALLGNGLVLALGACLEYLQPVISHRHFEVEDLLANYLGVVSGMFLGALLLWRKWQRKL